MTVADPSPGSKAGLPERRVSLSRIVAYNMAAFRKAADLSQQEFGEGMGGWSAASVSAAERSWDGNRVKKFDADELMRIAAFLGLPLAALFLPPEDDGTTFRYVLENDLAGPAPLRDLLPLILGAAGGESPAMTAYRKRLIALGWSADRDEALERARREGAEIVARAERDAAATMAEAREALAAAEARKALGEAQSAVDAAIIASFRQRSPSFKHTRDEVAHVLTQARQQAEQITGDARSRAESLERDAQERHRQAMGSLVTEREELERRVNELRDFEREYRRRFQAFLEDQYRAFWAGAGGIDIEGLLEAMRKVAEARGPGETTAILLGPGGAYDILTEEQAAELAREKDQREGGFGKDEGEPGSEG